MNHSETVYIEFISAVVRSNNFRTVFFYAPEHGIERCHMANWLSLKGNIIPSVMWDSVKSFKLVNCLHAELLFLACLPGDYREELLKSISNFLHHMRQTKVLIELSAVQNATLVNRVLQYCLQNNMYNAMLYFSDFEQSHTVYSFDVYPNYALKTQQFGQTSFELYPDKMADLKGYRLRTQPDLSEPNTILIYGADGQPRFLGNVWNMIEEYLRKHNARLQLSYKPELGKVLTHIQVLDLAQEGLVDIAASVQPITLSHVDRYWQYAYPVKITNWCTMLPLDPYIEVGEYYGWVLPTLTVLFLVVLYLIYEWQKGRRLLRIGWLILAGLLALNVQGRLLGLFIAPPTKGLIRSFGDLQNSNTRILALRYEYNEFDFDTRTKYASAFYLTDKMQELISMRNSLNTSYGYTVTREKWSVYAEQQGHSSSQLFYFSEDICFFQFVPFSLIMPENSPHREPLHKYTLQIVESGLYAHWVSKSFYYMVQAGRLQIRDLGETRQSRTLTMQDLHLVLYAYAVGVLISFILFVCELIIYYIRAR
ncbi:hypothetical protein KR222_003343 [Zaprionus bogoriensis]|nr:hypothetical protein KR222_003343 [Zaprionus bogoriensis]